MQCFICPTSNLVCGNSGTTAAITKVHCLCDVSCCLAMDRERLQGSFSQTDMRTLIKFHVVLFIKDALECYKSMNKGLGTHAPSHKAVCWWVNAIQFGREEETDDAARSRARHLWQMNATWNKWNVLERTRSISCMAIATEDRISPASVYQILTNSLGNQKKKKWKVDSTSAQWHPIAMSVVCSWHRPSAMKEKWRQCISSSHFNSWCVIDAFIGPSAEMTECWMVCPDITKERNCMAQSWCSENHAHHVLQPKWTFTVPTHAN